MYACVCVCRLLYRSNILSRFTLNVSWVSQKEMSNKKFAKFLTKLQVKFSLMFLLLFFVFSLFLLLFHLFSSYCCCWSCGAFVTLCLAACLLHFDPQIALLL